MKKDKMAAPSPMKEDERDYDAEHAFDTISRAEEHKADPKMMERVKKHAGRKLKAMKGLHEIMGTAEEKQEEPVKSIDDLRKVRNKKALGNMG